MATRPLFVPTQPRRCADQEAGLGGACLACGAVPGALCKAPAGQRYREPRSRR